MRDVIREKQQIAEKSECTFDPQFNPNSVMKVVGVKDKSEPKWQNFEQARKERLYRAGKQRVDRSAEDIRYEKENSECSFKPLIRQRSTETLTKNTKQQLFRLPTASTSQKAVQQNNKTTGKSNDSVKQLLKKNTPKKPKLLKLDVKVSKTQSKRLVIDLNLDNPLHKVEVFSAINCLSKKQQECLNEAIRSKLNAE